MTDTEFYQQCKELGLPVVDAMLERGPFEEWPVHLRDQVCDRLGVERGFVPREGTVD